MARMEKMEGELSAERQRARDLELENARLEGRLEGGGGRSEPKFRFNTEQEYRLYGNALDTEAKHVRAAAEHGDEEAKSRFATLQQEWQATDREFRAFQETQTRKAEERRTREEARISFLATRGIDPKSELGRMVGHSHENGVPLERIEALMISPSNRAREAARERGADAVRDAGVRRMGAANIIEEGVSRTKVPAPVGEERVSPEQAASNDLVRRYEEYLQPIDEQLFGE